MRDALHLFVDLYERDYSALMTLLEDETGFGLFDELNTHVSAVEQLRLLEESSALSAGEIKRKTLISIASPEDRHSGIKQDISGDMVAPFFEPLPDVPPDRGLLELVVARFKAGDIDIDELIIQLDWAHAASHGISVSDFQARRRSDSFRRDLSRKRIDSELMRFFADQIEPITNAIEQLDDADFSRQIPAQLQAAFRELHINAFLGNNGTTTILCGAVLEQSLQDLLPTNSSLRDAIEEAKKVGLLENHSIRFALKVCDARNKVVHGKIKFEEVSSDEAWEYVSLTRLLVGGLYHSRLDES